MQLHLTDGKSQADFTISEDMDAADCARIRDSKRPVQKAFDIIKKRHDLTGMWPIQGQALTGI